MTNKTNKIEKKIIQIGQNIANLERIADNMQDQYKISGSRPIDSEIWNYKINPNPSINLMNIYEERIPVYREAINKAESETLQAKKALEVILNSIININPESEEAFEKNTKKQIQDINSAKREFYQKSLVLKTAHKKFEYINRMLDIYKEETRKTIDEHNARVVKIYVGIKDKQKELWQKKTRLEQEKTNLEKRIGEIKEDEKTIRKIEFGAKDWLYDSGTLENAIRIGLSPKRIKASLDNRKIVPYYFLNDGLEDSLEAINHNTKESGKIKQLQNKSYVFEMDLGYQKIEFPIEYIDEEKIANGKSRMVCRFPERKYSIAVFSPEKSLDIIKKIELRDKSLEGYSKFAESLKLVADYYTKELQRIKEKE